MGFLRDMILGPPREEELERVEPLEGTNISLYNTIIPSWWQENIYGYPTGTAALAERVWVANRCIQLNAQQIAGMPLEYHGPLEPAWVSSPDPNWYPNGIGDALHAITALMYGWGFACIFVTDVYADGFPRRWTVLDSGNLSIRMVDGEREYRYGETVLDARRIIQIDRNPGIAAHGTSALRSYAQQAWGLLAAGNQSMTVNQGGVPSFYLQMVRGVTEEQAKKVQGQWAERVAERGGLPPVVPPEIEPKTLSINPSDLALLDTQEWNAKAIATAYGVPAVMLNMGVEGSHIYQSPSALGEMWWRFELRPTATRIANAFSAQLLPAGQWVTFDAADTFAPLTELSEEDDPQLSQVAKASPAQQPRPLTAIGGSP